MVHERILVPLDGSSAAEMVIPYAEEIAVKFKSDLVLMNVSEPSGPEVEHLYRSYLEHTVEQTESLLRGRKEAEATKVSLEVLLGDPATEILRRAAASDIVLIAMASRGCSADGQCYEPWLLGSIASKVVQASDKPVLLVKAPADKVLVEKRNVARRILVPLDGSKIGETAIPLAERLAQALDAELVLFHVLELAPLPVMLAPGIQITYPVVTPDQQARQNVAALTYLERVEQRLVEKGLRVSSATSAGSPAAEIVKYAEANGISLIAISTHGRSGVERWVLGSVAERLLHLGNTAMLTVRASRE